MNYRKNLIAGLIGFAMLAAPITATAMDNDTSRNDSRQPQAQAHQAAPESHANRAPARANAPEHNNSEPAKMTRKEAPATTSRAATRAEPREQHAARTESKTPAVATHRDSREVRGDSHEVRGEANRSNHVASNDHRDGSYDHRDYRGHDYGGYAVAEPIYVMPRGYAGGACAWARHLRHVYYQDENTGHPAAAADVLVELHRAERNCGGVPYSYGY